jgi:3-isopropylmalate dehydrogenase
VRLLPGVQVPVVFKPGEIDYVIARENTEGLYASRGLGVMNQHAASDILFMTRPGVERIARFAFEQARRRSGAPRDGKRRVTCVAKTNVLKSMGFFHRIVEEVGESYPDVEKELLYTDAAAQAMVMEPQRFDVLVMENFLGDLLSDLGGGTVGGIGMCPSGNIGDGVAYFEPIHGSAPALAGKGVANPIATVLSGAMLLDHIGQGQAAEAVRGAVYGALEAGGLRIGANGCPEGGTAQATRAIVERLQ